MAARKRALHLTDEWRAKIQTSMLINRLSDFVNGKIELTPAQVTAALGLLRKTAPDLQASENKTEVTHNYVARLPTVSKDMDAWEQSYGQKLKGPTVQ